MSTIVKTHLFEQDLHGTNPDNLITDEIQTLQVPGINDYYFIIPRAAPYFVSSLKVFNAQTNEPYIENEDYIIGHHFIEAMDSIGRPIAGSIRFMKRTIKDQVRLEYRTLGGNWGFDDTAILAELGRRHYNPITRVWGNIQALPYSFPPHIHDQDLDTLVGSEQLDETLNMIASTIENSADNIAESHINDFNNPHRVTAEQLDLEKVMNYGMATPQQTIEGKRFDLYVNPKGVADTIKAMVGTALEDHINETGNVHNLTKADLGLEHVLNWKAATELEAIAGEHAQRVMSPLRVDDYVNANLYTPLSLLFEAAITDLNG